MGLQNIRCQLLFIIFFLFGISLHAQNQIEEEIVIKLKPIQDKNTFALLNQSQISSRLRAYGVKNIRKLGKQNSSSQNQKSNYRTLANKNQSVDRIYKLKVDNTEKERILELLKTLDWVEYAEPIHQYELLYVPNDTYQVFHWGHANTQTYEAWDISQGDTSVVIGIVDSGVKATHPSLATQLFYNNAERFGKPGEDDDLNGFVDDSLGYNFAEQNTDISDVFSHGTEVAGMAVAKVNDAFGTFGTGHNTRFMPIKITNAAGQILNVFEAMLYAAEMGCKIINVSLGRSGGGVSQYEQDIINFITEEYDALIIAAAGNTNGHYDFYPSSYENVLSVAHSMQSDERYFNGSYSYFVDIMAPGDNLPTTYIGADFQGHSLVTGSSYAAPFTAGVAGLLRAAYPNLKAPQVAQILRMSADDVYDLAGNQNFIDKLGKGRLNALNALTMAESLKSVRANNIAYAGSEGELMVRGDTANITAEFKNILNQLSSGAKVTLTTNSPYVQIIDSVFNLGEMLSLSKVDNNENPFKIKLADNLPENQQIYFKLLYEDENYQDHQYFYFYTDSYFHVKKHNWKLSLEGNGRLGYIGNEAPFNGLGLKWKDKQLINDAGLIFAVDSLTVSDAICINDTTKSSNFNKQSPFNTQTSDSATVITEYFYDAFEYTEVHFQQKINFIENTDYLTVTYKVINNGTDSLKDAKIGLFTDFFLDETKNNTAAWDSLYQLGYVFEDDLYFGIKIFDSLANFISLDKQSTTGIKIADGFTDEEKYQTLISNNNGQYFGEADVAQVNSYALPPIVPGDTAEVSFVLAAGNSIEELQGQMELAAKKLNYLPYYSELPQIADTTLCRADANKITWKEGNQYKFYNAVNAKESFHYGNELDITSMGDTIKLFVSNHDNVIESEKVPITIYISSPSANLDLIIPDTTIVEEPILITIINPDSVTLEWDFNSGVSYYEGDSLFVLYNEKGNYIISLTEVDSLGCGQTITKQIQALKKSDAPVIDQTLQICAGDNVLLSPTGGNTFRYYLEDTLFFQGSELLIPKVETPFSIEISNVSDDLESTRVTVSVLVNQLPNLIEGVDWFIPDTIVAEEPFELYALNSGSLDFTWDLGDGTQYAQQDTVLHTYTAKGNYTLSLSVIDQYQCTFNTSKIVQVFKRSAIPQVADTLSVCYAESVTIAPENGSNFRFYAADTLVSEGNQFTLKALQSPVQVIITNISDDIESERKNVYVDINPVPDIVSFTDMPDSLSIEVGEIEINALYGIAWEWETSNGFTANTQQINLSFNEIGTESVSITVSDTFGCTYRQEKEIVIWQSTPTSLNTLNQKAAWQIYPSPVKDYLSIVVPNNLNTKISIELYNIKGKALPVKISEFGNSYKVDVRDLPSGIFLLNIIYGNETLTKKIIKER